MNDRLSYRVRGASDAVRASIRGGRAGTRPWLWAAGIAVALAAWLAWAVLRPTSAPAPLERDTAGTVELLPQDLAVVEVGPLRNVVPLTGTLQPLDRTQLKSQLAGEIVEVSVRAGDSVQKGQVLARLDGRDFRSRLAEKLAQRAANRSQLALAQKKRDQTRALFAKDLIAKTDLDNAESEYRVSEANLRSADAQIEQARKAVEDAVVRSPMDGVVSERLAQPGFGVAPGTPLFSVLDLSTMELAALVPASDIPAVRIGQEASFRVEGFGPREFTGRVERINPGTEPGSRSIAVYLRIANPAGELRAGMFAQGSVLVEQSESAMLIPATAVHQEDGATVVYRIENDVVQRQPIQIGAEDRVGGRVDVTSGLEPGARVVVGAIANLRPGLRVRVTELGGAPPAADR